MPDKNFITLTDSDGATAVIAPELGGWLLRYGRMTARHGMVEALHYSQAVVDRYPREMYAGSPVLFPLVGSNRVGEQEHQYEWNGQVHPMPQHGFARRSRWAVIARSATSLTMELEDQDSTRADYPFAFRHCLTYSLAGGRLRWEQVIENRSESPMPFSSGFHPYFAVPLTTRSERAACFVEIPEARRLTPVGKFERFTAEPFPAQNWSVQKDVASAMFLGDLKKRELILVDPGSELEVVLDFEEAPQHRFVAIWSKGIDQPFYCLEPWTALPNSFARARDHELILLEPRKTFRAAFSMELRPMA